MPPNTKEPLQACPYTHDQDSWCMLCGRTVCPACTVSLSGDQKLCLACHHHLAELNAPRDPRENSPELHPGRQSLLNPKKAPITSGLCLLLVGIYLLSSIPDIAAVNEALADRFSLSGSEILAYHQYERLLTGNLLHANLTHLGFNVFALFIFGSMLEPVIHRGVYLLWLVMFMLGCDVLSLWLLPGASIGASGIAYGLQSAFLTMATKQNLAESRGSVIETLVSLRSYVLVMLIILVSDAMSDSMLNVYGHLGGALAGILAAGLYPAHRQATTHDLVKLLLLLALLAIPLLQWLGF